MAGVFDRVTTGQPLAGIRAGAWNAMLAAAEAHQGGRRDQPANHGQQWGTVEALALNSTGAAIREYKPATVTAAGGYDLTADTPAADWNRRPLLTLGVPAAATDYVVVTLEAIPAGSIGRVAVSGVCLCDVHVNSSGHAYASPTTNTTALESAAAGPIRILHKGTGSSTRRCAVYLGDQVPDSDTPLNSQNTDGTEVDATTTDLRFDKTTGSKITQSGGVSTHTLLAASASQTGAMTTGIQTFSGAKTFNGDVTRSNGGNNQVVVNLVTTDIAQVTVSSLNASALLATNGTTTYGISGVTAATPSGGGYFYSGAQWDTGLGGFAGAVWADDSAIGVYVGANRTNAHRGAAFARPQAGAVAAAVDYDIYADLAEWSGSPLSGPVRHRQNSYIADGKYWGATRSGVDTLGADATVSGLVFVAGLYTSGTLSYTPGAGSISTSMLANNSVTDPILRDSAALSVIGRSANSTGDPADIAAGTDGHVLRRSGTALGFGTLAAGAFASDTIAPASLAFSATSRFGGRITGGAGAGEELTGTQATTLLDTATASLKGLVPALADGQVFQGTGSGPAAQFPFLWEDAKAQTSSPKDMLAVSNNTNDDIAGCSITLPGAGRYEITVGALGALQDSAAGGALDIVLIANGASVGSYRVGYAGAAATPVQQQGFGRYHYTAAGSVVVKLAGIRNTIGTGSFYLIFNAYITAVRIGP